MKDRVRVGLVGSQFISTIHAESLRRSPDAQLWAVASPTPGNAQRFAARHDVPHALPTTEKCSTMDDLDLVVIGVPNDLHCPITSGRGGGRQARRHRETAVPEPGRGRPDDRGLPPPGRQADVRRGTLLRAQVRAAQAAACVGRFGAPLLLKQSEKHDGPHAAHFWDVERSGGGVTMDMGCHAIEFFRWMLGRPTITSVYAQMST